MAEQIDREIGFRVIELYSRKNLINLFQGSARHHPGSKRSAFNIHMRMKDILHVGQVSEKPHLRGSIYARFFASVVFKLWRIERFHIDGDKTFPADIPFIYIPLGYKHDMLKPRDIKRPHTHRGIPQVSLDAGGRMDQSMKLLSVSPYQTDVLIDFTVFRHGNSLTDRHRPLTGKSQERIQPPHNGLREFNGISRFHILVGKGVE